MFLPLYPCILGNLEIHDRQQHPNDENKLTIEKKSLEFFSSIGIHYTTNKKAKPTELSFQPCSRKIYSRFTQRTPDQQIIGNRKEGHTGKTAAV